MSLGQRIARLRQERNLTLQDVAGGAGLTPSFLSRLERDQVNISVANLRKLARFFTVPMAYFFEDEETGPPAEIIPASERLHLSRSSEGVDYYGLTPPNADIDARMLEAQAGTGHQGEGERMVYVLRGQVRYYISEEVYTLDVGDTLYVHHDAPQRWECVGADSALVLLVRPNIRRDL